MLQVLRSANHFGKFYVDLSIDERGVYVLTFFRWGLPPQHREFIFERRAIEQYEMVLKRLKS